MQFFYLFLAYFCSMKKLMIFVCALVLCSCSRSVLEPAGWDPDVHHALTAVLKKAPKAFTQPYAVFDCDNTSIIYDLEHTLVTYQIENLCFADAPEHHFTDGVADPSVHLDVFGCSAWEAGGILADEFRQLKRMQEQGKSLEEIHASELYLDFRARFLVFNHALTSAVDYQTACLWYPSLMSGMTVEEARKLCRTSIHHWIETGPREEEEWVSPDGRWREFAEKGLAVPENMKHLYKALRKQGIDTFICSASLEMIVEELACDTEIGFGLEEDHVFGMRLSEGERIIPTCLEGYPQPCKEGKVENIKTFIAPEYGGEGPVLVAGDSDGDVAMLTAWPETFCSLIMDCGRKGEIAVLADKARSENNKGRFVVQSVHPVKGGY